VVPPAVHAPQASAAARPGEGMRGKTRPLSAALAVMGNAPGLGLLPLVTSFGEHKTLARTCVRFGQLLGPWQRLSGVEVSGYEIHQGQTAVHPAMQAAGHVAHEVLPALGWQDRSGAILGVYLHGLFEDPAVMAALFGARVPTLEHALQGLGAVVAAHMDTEALHQWVGE
jgi:adenosylcobyric acid synthase